MSSSKIIVNKQSGVKIDIKPGATCKTEGVIYALNCKKCEKIYVGHTGDSISKRFLGHKYDAAKNTKGTKGIHTTLRKKPRSQKRY